MGASTYLCSSCGIWYPRSALKQNPFVEMCPSCGGKLRLMRRNSDIDEHRWPVGAHSVHEDDRCFVCGVQRLHIPYALRNGYDVGCPGPQKRASAAEKLRHFATAYGATPAKAAQAAAAALGPPCRCPATALLTFGHRAACAYGKRKGASYEDHK